MTTTEKVVNAQEFKPYRNFEDMFANLSPDQNKLRGEVLQRYVVSHY